MIDVSNFLEHWGVMGMKWGVRNNGKSSRRSSKKEDASDDSKRATTLLSRVKSSGVKALTNDELAEFNNRLQLEQRFSQLAPESSFKKGMSFTKDILNVGATVNQAASFVSSPTGRAIANSLKKKPSASKFVKKIPGTKFKRS